jgi:L-lactate dehydrogenase
MKDVTVALPHLVGGQGVITTLWQPLSATEREGLRKSAEIVRNAISALHL